MSSESRDIIEIMNKVKDFLWLGNISKVKHLLSIAVESPHRESLEGALSRTVEVHKTISSRLGADYGELQYYGLLSEEFRKDVTRLGIEVDDAILGALASYGERLIASLKSVERLYDVKEEPGYDYVLFETSARYEIRSVLKSKMQDPNRIRETLGNGFSIGRMISTKRYFFVTCFSNRAYIEISAFEPRVQILASFPESDMRSAEVLGKSILDALVGS